MMGSRDGVGDPDEHPQHRVTLSNYCIDMTEVTAGAYGLCVAKGECKAATEPATAGRESLCNGTREDRRGHPVNCVTWKQAKVYCEWAGKRLPSEAEWEYAARGSEGRTYPWGEAPPSARLLNACGSECRRLGEKLGLSWDVMYADTDGWGATAPVETFSGGKTPLNVFDLAGNVWEWTADLYARYDAPPNPNDPDEEADRVYRGGGFHTGDVSWVRGAHRFGAAPGVRHPDLGFRCARGR
jgi:formylglycine-generating enzyme required for sulfatase activity